MSNATDTGYSPKKYSQFDIRPSAIDFEKQLSREEYRNAIINRKNNSLNQSPVEREDSFSRASTQIIKSSVGQFQRQTPDWRKQSPKKTLLNSVKRQFYNCGDYNPTYDKVEPKLSIGSKYSSLITLIM
jgi:hypothetical protein